MREMYAQFVSCGDASSEVVEMTEEREAGRRESSISGCECSIVKLLLMKLFLLGMLGMLAIERSIGGASAVMSCSMVAMKTEAVSRAAMSVYGESQNPGVSCGARVDWFGKRVMCGHRHATRTCFGGLWKTWSAQSKRAVRAFKFNINRQNNNKATSETR